MSRNLFAACGRGDVEYVANCISDASRMKGRYMYIALKRGRVSVVQLLLDRGATLRSCNPALIMINDNTSMFNLVHAYNGINLVAALFYACKKGYLNHVKRLADEIGSDFRSAINAIDMNGNTPVQHALFGRHFDVLKYLLYSGYEYDCQLRPLLQSAVFRHDLEAVVILLTAGVNINEYSQDRRTALSIAVRLNDYAICELLIAYGAQRETVPSEILQMAEPHIRALFEAPISLQRMCEVKLVKDN